MSARSGSLTAETAKAILDYEPVSGVKLRDILQHVYPSTNNIDSTKQGIPPDQANILSLLEAIASGKSEFTITEKKGQEAALFQDLPTNPQDAFAHIFLSQKDRLWLERVKQSYDGLGANERFQLVADKLVLEGLLDASDSEKLNKAKTILSNLANLPRLVLTAVSESELAPVRILTIVTIQGEPPKAHLIINKVAGDIFAPGQAFTESYRSQCLQALQSLPLENTLREGLDKCLTGPNALIYRGIAGGFRIDLSHSGLSPKDQRNLAIQILTGMKAMQQAQEKASPASRAATGPTAHHSVVLQHPHLGSVVHPTQVSTSTQTKGPLAESSF